MVTPKILLFYYLMSYETKRRETLISMSNLLQNMSSNQSNYSKSHLTNFDSLFNFCYSSEIFDYIPINYLLVRAKEPEFLIIYPSLLR